VSVPICAAAVSYQRERQTAAAHIAGGDMNDTPALPIAMAFLDAWTAGDFERARGLLADDFAFDGPVAHYRSADDFLAGSKGFVDQIVPSWTRIAAFGDDGEALLLYDLHFRNGQPMRVADHHIVRDGRIRQERILFDRGAPS
jgi:ketosteroid isomerase-like protein